MFAARSLTIRFTRTAVVAVQVVAIACGGGKDATTTTTTVDAPPPRPTEPVVPIVPASNTTPSVSLGVTRPTDAHGWYMLGISSRKSGDFKGAKEAFDKSIELNPKFSKAYFNQARVLLDMKRAPEALELIEQGRALDSSSFDGWRLKARAQAENGDGEGAMKTYRELIAANDADGWSLNNFGVMLLQRGEFREAIGPLSRAVQVQPHAPLFQNNLGMALERSGYKVAALRHYEEALKNDSTFSKALRNLERMKGIVVDSIGTPEVDVRRTAEEFRQKVKEWKPKG